MARADAVPGLDAWLDPPEDEPETEDSDPDPPETAEEDRDAERVEEK